MYTIKEFRLVSGNAVETSTVIEWKTVEVKGLIMTDDKALARDQTLKWLNEDKDDTLLGVYLISADNTHQILVPKQKFAHRF
jgi:hypothetical protein